MYRATMFWPRSLICSCMLDDFLPPTEQEAELYFEQVPFNHPLFIMYSSGTTGAPKCMVHSVGVSIYPIQKILVKKALNLKLSFLEWGLQICFWAIICRQTSLLNSKGLYIGRIRLRFKVSSCKFYGLLARLPKIIYKIIYRISFMAPWPDYTELYIYRITGAHMPFW